MAMQIVLNEDVKKLGYRGDIVNVKPGYFRNFLYPRGAADLATPARLKLVDSRKEKMVMQKEELLDKAKEVIGKLKDLKVIIKAKVTTTGKLYGAITEQKVIDAIEKATKVKLEKDYIKMEHFKELGEYKAVVHLGDDLEVEVLVVIEAAGEKKA